MAESMSYLKFMSCFGTCTVHFDLCSFNIEVVFHMPNLKQESIPRQLLAPSVASSTSGPGMRRILGSLHLLLDLLQSSSLEEKAAALFCFVYRL